MAAVCLTAKGIQAGFQGSQPGGVGGLDLLAKGFRLFLPPAEVLLDFALVAEIVSEGSVDVGQRQRVQAAGDLYRRHPLANVINQHVQRNARLSNSNRAGLIDTQWTRIGM